MIEFGNQKIAIVTDTSSDLLDEQIEQYDIRMISLRVLAQKGEYRDRLEISHGELYELLKTELPKSSLPLPGDVTDVYNKLIEEGCTQILHLCISSGLSGTYNMARLVAKDYEGKMPITVFDTKTLSAGLGMLVIEACKILAETGDVKACIAKITALREAQLGCFVIRTLEFLRKGGRIGLVEGMLGTLLQLKPVIFVNPDGIYQTLAKARGYSSAIETMTKEMVSRFGNQKLRLTVVHGQALEEANKLLLKLKDLLNVCETHIAPISAALVIHTGPGLVGVIAQPF